MVFAYIEAAKKKPEAERRKLVLVWAVGITATIALLWITTMVISYSARGGAGGQAVDRPTTRERLVAHGDRVKGGWQKVVGGIRSRLNL
jgi:hypothetical protein